MCIKLLGFRHIGKLYKDSNHDLNGIKTRYGNSVKIYRPLIIGSHTVFMDCM